MILVSAGVSRLEGMREIPLTNWVRIRDDSSIIVGRVLRNGERKFSRWVVLAVQHISKSVT